MNKLMQFLLASLFVLVLCVRVPAASAEPQPVESTPAELGKIGLGGLIGGLVAGPPGAVVGIAGGAWLSERDKSKGETIETLKAKLEERSREVARMQADFESAQAHVLTSARQVAARGDGYGAQRPLSLAVYFRTDQARIEDRLAGHLARLGAYLNSTPDVVVYLEGYADARGNESYNMDLSRRRVSAVRHALESAGVEPARIREHAYGESRAISPEGDRDAMAFDRSVVINVTLDTEA